MALKRRFFALFYFALEPISQSTIYEQVLYSTFLSHTNTHTLSNNWGWCKPAHATRKHTQNITVITVDTFYGTKAWQAMSSCDRFLFYCDQPRNCYPPQGSKCAVRHTQCALTAFACLSNFKHRTLCCNHLTCGSKTNPFETIEFPPWIVHRCAFG